MAWLRLPNPQGVASIQEVVAKRTESTVNVILTLVCMLYDFHEKTGKVPHIAVFSWMQYNNHSAETNLKYRLN